MLIAGYRNGIMLLWDTQTGKIATKYKKKAYSIKKVVFCDNGNYIVSLLCTNNSPRKYYLSVVKTTTEEELFFKGFGVSFKGFAVTKDPKYIIVSTTGDTKILDFYTGKETRIINTQINGKMAITNNNKYLVGTRYSDLFFYDFQTGEEKGAITGHSKSLVDFEITENNKIVSVSKNKITISQILVPDKEFGKNK